MPDPGLLQFIEVALGKGAPYLAALILAASFFEIWMWTKDHRREIAALKEQHGRELARLEAAVAEQKKEAEKWESLLFSVIGPLQGTLEQQQQRRPRG